MSTYKFNKSDRSSFSYWFAHWCAFQMTASNLHVWRPKYLLHDIEKPWLKLFMRDYKAVQTWHRTNNPHHLEYTGKKDYLAMMIDWECSHFTKNEEPLNARDTMSAEVDKLKLAGKDAEAKELTENMLPLLNKFGL